MKKTLLSFAVLSLISQTVVAEEPEVAPVQRQPMPAIATPNPSSEAVASNKQSIDCNYAIAPQTTQVDPDLVVQWTEKATEQSFTFDYSQIDNQMEQLKKCFTSQGWQGFQEAFNKSGNLNAIKTQQLSVSAMVEGKPVITENKGNEWKLTLPLQVVYQNKQQKLSQQLMVDVLVGRKLTGDLGIMQVVAIPKKADAPITSNTPASAMSNETPPPTTPEPSTSNTNRTSTPVQATPQS